MREPLILNPTEQKHLKVLYDIDAGSMEIEKTATLPGLSVRHVYRLSRRYRQEGAASLVHGNRGRPSHRPPTPANSYIHYGRSIGSFEHPPSGSSSSFHPFRNSASTAMLEPHTSGTFPALSASTLPYALERGIQSPRKRSR
jgi:hypothetical protein